MTSQATDEDVMRVFVPGEGGARVCSRWRRPSTCRCGTCAERPTLEDVFATAVGE